MITSIVLGFLCLAMFTLSRGQPVSGHGGQQGKS